MNLDECDLPVGLDFHWQEFVSNRNYIGKERTKHSSWIWENKFEIEVLEEQKPSFHLYYILEWVGVIYLGSYFTLEKAIKGATKAEQELSICDKTLEEGVPAPPHLQHYVDDFESNYEDESETK